MSSRKKLITVLKLWRFRREIIWSLSVWLEVQWYNQDPRWSSDHQTSLFFASIKFWKHGMSRDLFLFEGGRKTWNLFRPGARQKTFLKNRFLQNIVRSVTPCLQAYWVDIRSSSQTLWQVRGFLSPTPYNRWTQPAIIVNNKKLIIN